ncbi:unnamed protein product [Owenia fusiformis]|uniref:Uncharacterized protein n=1 Tax=Owenia fusiformis TaxID=6347 RepID=A0A8J1UMK6_OWEFU|nr:unnamed protein product [Owenia fusiformis]
MSLVKLDADKSEETKAISVSKKHHKIPGSANQPVIDYANLDWLMSHPGLRDRKNPESSEEAHQHFMENYRCMFVQPKAKGGLPVHTEMRSTQKLNSNSSLSTVSAGDKTDSEFERPVKKTNPVDEISHDIRDHLSLLHKQRKSENERIVRAEQIKTLRKILRKLSFQRTAAENNQIYKILRTFRLLSTQVSDNVLKELCVVATIDTWKEQDFTVFGNTGFHLILRGSCAPQGFPWVRMIGDPEEDFISPSATPDPQTEGLPKLGVGDCFGTLVKIEGRDPNSRILTVQTLEENCEFLKISTSDYQRVIEQIKQRGQTEKVNLLLSCENYKMWPRQPLVKVANLVRWQDFPANTVLVSEGYVSPFIAIVKSGECHALQQVEVMHTLPNGSKERKLKQVVMGKLHESQSFGEISVLTSDPMKCTIVTGTNVEMGIIEPEQIKDLDDVTITLMQQSSTQTFGDLNTEKVKEEYVEQELKREWNEFKHNIVVEVVNAKGIRPGYGKWAKP